MSISFPLRRGLVLVPLFLACPSWATAPSEPASPSIPMLQDIVVTASRSPEPLADVVGDVTLVPRTTLQNAGGDSVARILSRTPGVQFTDYGGPQTATSVFIRGAGPSQSLILVDGVRINSSITGLSLFPALDPSQIERIEVLRGSASSLYGSDALGGVVNIITRRSREDTPLSLWANAGYGSQATARTSLGLSGATAGWDYSLSGSTDQSRGFDATRSHYADGSPNSEHHKDRDGYRSHAWSGTLGRTWAAGHRLGLTAFNSYSRADFDSSYYDADTFMLYPGLDNVTSHYRQQVYTLSTEDRITDGWDSIVRWTWARESNESRTPMSNNLTASTRQTLSWQNNWQIQPNQRLSLLAEHGTERIEASSAFDLTQRQTNAVALIYKAQLGKLRTQASLRNDNYTGHGNKPTGSLALDYDLTDRWQIGVAANTGFRMPTFSDLYQNLPEAWYRGNPNLKPESSRNVEVHLRYEDETTQVSLTLYRNQIRDLITYVSNPLTFEGTMDNVHRATLQGLTLAGSQRLGQTTLHASLDLLDPRNDDPAPADAAAGLPAEGAQLPRRARQVFNLGVTHRLYGWNLGAEYQYTGNRYDDLYNRTRLGGYSLVNLTAEYAFTKSLGMQVRWNNILDKHYTLVNGYNTPGSNVFVNLSWKTP
ncbi:TonB-dependent receptor domain-containing protein [Castellaniella sp.]|uniref:TonB-dependent receptor domain-containing protein n=1 Tax=Castellaniella sp. TaxID=1955812 RepID=UPI003564E58C